MTREGSFWGGVYKLLGIVIHWASGEFVLKRIPNGGTAVFIRSLLAAGLVYALAVSTKALLTPNTTWQFDPDEARKVLVDTLPWLGAIFAGVYVALYSRFASQWNYLANLYNQIMATAVQCPPAEGSAGTNALRLWQAGFIEDADDLHLASKPMFASIVRSMLAKDGVRSAFIRDAPGGETRLLNLEARVNKALEIAAKKQGASAPAIAATHLNTQWTCPDPGPANL